MTFCRPFFLHDCISEIIMWICFYWWLINLAFIHLYISMQICLICEESLNAEIINVLWGGTCIHLSNKIQKYGHHRFYVIVSFKLLLQMKLNSLAWKSFWIFILSESYELFCIPYFFTTFLQVLTVQVRNTVLYFVYTVMYNDKEEFAPSLEFIEWVFGIKYFRKGTH